MKNKLSVSRIASLLAVVLVSMFSFGCANPIGHPTFGWTKPKPAPCRPSVAPPGYQMVPIGSPAPTAPAVAPPTPAPQAAVAPAPPQIAPVPPVPGLVAPTNGYTIIRAPGFLQEDKVVSSGKSPYRVRFINVLAHSVTVSVNHDTRKLEIPANGLQEISADPASTVVLYEVRTGTKLLNAGKVEMKRDEPLATVVIRSP